MIRDLKEEGHPVTPRIFVYKKFYKNNFFQPKIDFKSFREVEMAS